LNVLSTWIDGGGEGTGDHSVRFIQATNDVDVMVPAMEGYSPSNSEQMGDSQTEAVPEEEGGAVESFSQLSLN
jgi:hypothetical protein